MMDISNSMNITMKYLNCQNNSAKDNFIVVINSQLNLINTAFSNIFTYSDHILFIIYSNFSMNDSKVSYFYPQFIYGSFSKLILDNNDFYQSLEEIGMFKVCAIFLQNNISFSIKSTNFSFLKNSGFGPVYTIIIIYY